jgi:hypothetical protein
LPKFPNFFFRNMSNNHKMHYINNVKNNDFANICDIYFVSYLATNIVLYKNFVFCCILRASQDEILGNIVLMVVDISILRRRKVLSGRKIKRHKKHDWL